MSNLSLSATAIVDLTRRVIVCAALASGGTLELNAGAHPFAPGVVRAVVESTDVSGGARGVTSSLVP